MWISKKSYNYIIFRLDEIEKTQTEMERILSKILDEMRTDQTRTQITLSNLLDKLRVKEK